MMSKTIPNTSNRFILKLFGLIASLIGLLWAASLVAADLSFVASVDQASLSSSDAVTLTVILQGKAANVPDPQFPDLSDFNIVSGPNESSNFQFINGQTSYSKSWSSVLNPRRTGQITIGSAQLTIKNLTYKTEPITLNVSGQTNPPPTTGQATPPPPSGSVPQTGGEPTDLFVRVTADNTNIYQNQQVVLTYTLYTRVSVNGYEISKLPSMPGFWQEELQQPQQPTVRDEVISGRHYRAAMLRQVAVFPTRSGELTIDPLDVSCQVQVQETQRRSRDPFDMLFNSPFDRFRTLQRVISTQPLVLHVKPLPEDGKPANFSGAVGDYSMQIDLDRRDVKTNEALTMSVRFQGDGNIKTLSKPYFKAPSDFESYEPKESVDINKSGSRISGTKVFEYVLIPRAPGGTTIPPIQFTYFNPSARSYKTLTGGGYDLNVGRGSGAASSPVISGIAKEDVKLLAEDVHYLKTPERLARISPSDRLSTGYMIFMLLPPLLAFGFWQGSKILGGAALQARLRSRKAYDLAKRELRNLKKVVTDTEGGTAGTYGQVHKVLLDFIGEKLHLPAFGLKEEEILGKMVEDGIHPDIVTQVKNIFLECNLARFTSGMTDSNHNSQIIDQADELIDQLESNPRSQS